MAIRVCLLVKGELERLPPAMMVAEALSSIGVEVSVVCSAASPSTTQRLSSAGVHVVGMCPAYARASGLRNRALHWVSFSRNAWEYVVKEMNGSLLWVASADTALALGKRLLEWPYVLEIFELHEDSWMYRRTMPGIASAASAVVVNDEFRADILRVWYKLDKTPFVLPNKPITLPKLNSSSPEGSVAADLLQKCGGRKIVLYQGHICPGRDLEPVAHAIAKIDSMHFVLMGLDNHGIAARLHQICPQSTHVPYIPPPEHLRVTQLAHLGVVAYDYDRLNSIFCAPNKIWEFASCGVPMICRDLPSLRYTVGAAGAGVCVPFDSGECITNGLQLLDEDREAFSKRARQYSDSVNLQARVSNIIDVASFKMRGHSNESWSRRIRGRRAA